MVEMNPGKAATSCACSFSIDTELSTTKTKSIFSQPPGVEPPPPPAPVVGLRPPPLPVAAPAPLLAPLPAFAPAAPLPRCSPSPSSDELEQLASVAPENARTAPSAPRPAHVCQRPIDDLRAHRERSSIRAATATPAAAARLAIVLRASDTGGAVGAVDLVDESARGAWWRAPDGVARWGKPSASRVVSSAGVHTGRPP